MATFKPVVLSGKVHLKQDGTSNIKIRLYHNKESQYFSTKYYVQPNYVDNSGTISPFAPNSELLNFEVSELLQKIRGSFLKLGNSRTRYMTCAELKQEIERSMSPENEFIDFVVFSKKVIQETKKEKTAEWYDRSLIVLCWFLKRNKIDIRTITSNLLNNMMQRLSIMGPGGEALEPGTISNYMRGIRSLYNKAKLTYNNEDYDIIRIPGDPFKRISIPLYCRKRKSINADMIKRIRDFETDKERTRMARDVFMMMFYMMGININDLYKLSCDKNGRIEYRRSKTSTDHNYDQITLSIKVEPELHLLLDKYSEGHFLSCFHTKYSNLNNFMRAVNVGLKDICENLKFDCSVTTNWARHSWASLARNKANVPKADIDFCLGHVNNDYKMADIYIDIDYGVCDRANRAVLNLLK